MDTLDEYKRVSNESIIPEFDRIIAEYDALKKSYKKLEENNSKVQQELLNLKKDLRDSEKNFRSLFDSMDEGFALHQLVNNEKGDPIDYRIVEVNKSYERIIGISAKNARGALASNLYGNAEAPYLKEYANVVKNKKPYIFETYFPALEKYFHISVTSPYSGYFIKIFSDITERIKNDEQIRENEKRFQLIAKNVSDVIWIYNLTQEKFTYISPSVERLSGFTPEEAIKQSLADLMSPKDYASIANIIAVNIIHIEKDKKSRTINNEVQFKHKDGSLVWTEISIYFQKNEKEEFELYGVSRNIENRKKFEKDLLENQVQLKSAMKIAGLGYYIVSGQNAEIEIINERAKTILGIKDEKFNDKLPLEFWISNIHEDDQAFLLNIHNEIYTRNKDSASIIYRYQHPQNGLIWINHSAEVLHRGVNEKEIRIFGVIQDITEIKQKEQELIEAKEKAEKNEIRFKAITENALEGISLADMNGNYVFVNSAFAQMVKYTKKELLHMNLFDLKVPEEKNSTLFNTLKQNPENKRGRSSRTKLLCKDNSIIYVDINAILLDIGNEKFALGIVRDVSDIVRWENDLIEAKEKAEESENRFRNIAEHSTDGITIADMDGNYIYVNKRFCEMSGFSRNELLRRTVFDMSAEILPKDEALALYQSDENLSGKEQYFTLHKKDGTKYHTEITGTIIEIDKQKLVLGFIKDISEIVRYQHDLITAKEKAEESDRLKSAFLMNVSHEIRTPMNGILGFINFLDEPDLDEKDRRSFIDIVNKSGQRLLNTINDIVEISKIEIGDIRLFYEETDVADLMRFHFDFFSHQAKEKGIKFKIREQIEGSEALITTDKQKLDGILMNLIRNAIKFTTKGIIEIGNYIENEKLYFYVSDTGKGIPDEKLEIIFDRFVQVELGSTRSYEGSGIGLSIVKAYLEALEGDIKVKSENGKGSTFLFSIPYLPVIKSYMKSEIKENSEMVPTVNTILIAEDDEVNYYFLETILSKEYNLIHAFNAEQAVELFKNNPEISLILMDIKMPGEFDGLEATRMIKEINQQIPIIAQTAYAMESDKAEAFKAGCIEYITKPFNVNNITALVRKYCNKENEEEM